MSRILFPLAVVAILLTGCVSDDPSMNKRSAAPAPATGPVHAPAAEPRREVLGVSVQGRPIEIEFFGDPAAPAVLILGAIHGDEVTTAHLTERLIALLRQDPSLVAGRRVAIIPVANPDGLSRKTRTNARGIDVNRNFPAKNFKPGGSVANRAGTQPVSEPESRAVLSAIAQVRPMRMISIHSIRRGRHCNNFDGPAESVAQEMARHNGYPVTDTMGYPTPGSLGSYAGIDLHIPIITLELPRELPAEQAWEQNREALLAAIRL